MAWLPPEEESGYAGPATLLVGETVLEVTVRLAGHLEPLDGLFHWYGRVDRTPELVALKDGGATVADLAIGDRAPVAVRLAEYDAWGHVLVTGVGAPPYPLEPVEVIVPAMR
jgi:hypothetical protein